MDDSDSELNAYAPNSADASALVSKWLEDSDEEIEASSALPSNSIASSSILTRAEGVGLGAEDLNELVAQRRLDPTERKMKYRMEASAKWKEQREKDALALAKRLEDDVYDNDSKSVQVSKKKRRIMGKNEIIEQYTTAKKKPKLETQVAEKPSAVQVEQVTQENNEVVFDFSASEKLTVEVDTTKKETKEKKRYSKDNPDKKKAHKHKRNKGDS